MYEDHVSDGSSASPIMISTDIDHTFGIISKKFTVHILRNMIDLNQTRFNEILKSIDGINNKTLSTRLRDMLESGLIDRKIVPGIPIKIEYSVTEKGKDVLPILHQMIDFSVKYKPDARSVDAEDDLEEMSSIPEPFKF
jgi:DNA-binding HxlR family transcriptional regulator